MLNAFFFVIHSFIFWGENFVKMTQVSTIQIHTLLPFQKLAHSYPTYTQVQLKNTEIVNSDFLFPYIPMYISCFHFSSFINADKTIPYSLSKPQKFLTQTDSNFGA